MNRRKLGRIGMLIEARGKLDRRKLGRIGMLIPFRRGKKCGSLSKISNKA